MNNINFSIDLTLINLVYILFSIRIILGFFRVFNSFNLGLIVLFEHLKELLILI
jgi:hypothetical protein